MSISWGEGTIFRPHAFTVGTEVITDGTTINPSVNPTNRSIWISVTNGLGFQFQAANTGPGTLNIDLWLTLITTKDEENYGIDVSDPLHHFKITGWKSVGVSANAQLYLPPSNLQYPVAQVTVSMTASGGDVSAWLWMIRNIT